MRGALSRVAGLSLRRGRLRVRDVSTRRVTRGIVGRSVRGRRGSGSSSRVAPSGSAASSQVEGTFRVRSTYCDCLGGGLGHGCGIRRGIGINGYSCSVVTSSGCGGVSLLCRVGC